MLGAYSELVITNFSNQHTSLIAVGPYTHVHFPCSCTNRGWTSSGVCGDSRPEHSGTMGEWTASVPMWHHGVRLWYVRFKLLR